MELVSIITPTYNCGEYLPYFLSSIIGQTYDKIQLVVVIDGAADCTEEVLKAYEERFRERGYELIVKRQPNLGQAAAVNSGLRQVTGDYLMWIDSDDKLEPECIAEMVEWLKEHPDRDFVICDARHVRYPSFETEFIFRRKLRGKKDPYFYDILNGTHNYTLGAGSLLVRTEKFRKAIPAMQIYESRQGQNYQLMLPLVYFCRWGYIHKPLYTRVRRPDSHFFRERTYEEQLKRQIECETIMKETIRRMGIPEEKKAFRLAENRFARSSFMFAFQAKDRAEMRKQMKVLLKNGALSLKEIFRYAAFGRTDRKERKKWSNKSNG